MTRTIIDIHVLQTVPPSNLNRDDQGSPKTAIYGGVERARVSSQAWKRATRLGFREVATDDLLGVRTKRVVEALGAAIAAQDGTIGADDAVALAASTIGALGLKLDKPRAKKDQNVTTPEATYLVFLSNGQLRNLAGIALQARNEGDAEAALKARKKELKAAASQDASVDVSLFGRMVADDTSLNVDAAAQVAHAISVHQVRAEADFFTAVDDIEAQRGDDAEDSGAAMIGTVEFNSSTLYRYATVDVDRLNDNLGSAEASRMAVEAFLRTFVTSMPTGKQNTFANRTLPDLVVVQLRDTQGVNLVGAFERAVTKDYVRSATEALVRRSQDIDHAFGTAPVQAWVVAVGDDAKAGLALGTESSLATLVEEAGIAVAERLQG